MKTFFFFPLGAQLSRQNPFLYLSSLVICFFLGINTNARAQTTVLFEGFEGAFPGGWYRGDADPSGPEAYWSDVNASFGGEGAHTGNWKGYCAGIGHGGTTDDPLYQDYMEADLSTAINLSGYDSATLTFWYKIPLMEICCDWAEVWMDGIDSVLLWRTNAMATSWTQATVDLSGFVGGTYTLRFRFDSDHSVHHEGWYLDDILVTGISPPSNDNCDGAIALFGGVPYTMTTAGATDDSRVPSCQPNIGKGVWFTYTPPVDSTIEVSSCGSDYDTVLQIYSGVLCRILTEMPEACNDDGGPDCPGERQASLRFAGTAQTPYHILVGGWNGQSGNLSIVARRIDETPPVITCSPNIVVGTDPGECFRENVTFNVTATDNVGVVFLACDPISGSTFPKGTTTVNCVAEDAEGNTAQCSFTVTVVDEEPPQILCPPDREVECGSSWTFDPPETWDNCDGPGTPVQVFSTVTNVFCGGTYAATRTWRTTDSSRNASTCEQTITVVDTLSPVLTGCPLDLNVECLDEVPLPAEVLVSDNCSGVQLSYFETQSNPGSSRSNLIVRTWTATDACGNVNSCVQNILVNDTSPPLLTCPPDIVADADAGTCSKDNVIFHPSISDNCPDVTLTCVPPSGSTFPVGSTTVTCTARDAAGNSTQCSFTVTIRDREPPVLNCPVLVSADTCSNGTVVTFSVTATDNCDVRPLVVCSPPSGSFFPMGSTTVSCETTDSSGNSAQCQFTVLVNPSLLPPFGLSSGTMASHPHVAYNSASNNWLVAWKEGNATYPGAGRIYCRLVGPEGQLLTSAVALDGLGSSAGPPRVAYEPLNDEFLVVWAAAGDPVEGSGPVRARARRVASNGALLGTQILAVSAPDGEGESNPDVAAGRVQVGTNPWQPYWMVVWEDTRTSNRRIRAQAVFVDESVGLSGLRRSDHLLVVDDTVALPNHQSYLPRLSPDAPMETFVALPGSDPIERTGHQLVFEVREGTGGNMLTEVYGARLAFNNVSEVANLTSTSSGSQNEFKPQIYWNNGNNRSLLVFLRGSEFIGQLYEPTGSFFNFDPLADEFAIRAGNQFAFDALPADGGYVGLTHPIAGNEGTRLAGHHVFSLFGVTTDTDQPALALNRQSGNSFLMTYRSGGFSGSQSVLGRVVCGIFPLPNHPPVADAGTDQVVFAQAPFVLDGSNSTDPDGDPVISRWTQISGPPASFLSSTNQLTISMEAPALPSGQTSTNLAFRLEVDDLRSEVSWPTNDTVAIQVRRGADGNPPIADAGPDQAVDEDSFVQLDGSQSYDPDGEPITFAWKFEGYSPSTNLPLPVLQPNSLTSNARFKTPRFAWPGGIAMDFRLRVTSASGGVSNDTVRIQVNDSVNEPPIAHAGDDQSVTEHTQFFLDGSKSWDPNGSALTYQWRLVSNLDYKGAVEESITMVSSNTAYPLVTASIFQDRDLVFELTVADPQASESTDLVTVQVQALPMSVTSASPMHGSPGTLVTIQGSDLASVSSVTFNGYGGSITPVSDSELRVRVPNGSRVRRPSGAFLSLHKAGLFDVWEYPEVTSGALVVTDGTQSWTSSNSFAVSHVELADVFLSQGASGYGLVQGKDSLLQVQVRTREATGSNAAISTATCYVFTNTLPGPAVLEITNTTGGPIRAVPRSATVTQMRDALNFFLDGRKLTGDHHRFTVSVENNGLEILFLESLGASDSFVKAISPRILMVPVVPFEGQQISTNWDEGAFWTNYFDALDHFKRVYPIPDVNFVVHSSYFSIPSMMDSDGLIELEAFNLSENFLADVLPGLVQMHGILENWNNGHPNQRAMFVVGGIAEELHDSSTTTGFGVPPRDMMARMVKYAITEDIPVLGTIVGWLNEAVSKFLCAFCLFLCDCPDPIEVAVKAFLGSLDVFGVKIEGDTCFVVMTSRAGSTLSHEVGHNLGFVDPYSPNSDPENLSHSKYDEGLHGENSIGLRFIDAPYVIPPVYNVTSPGDMYFETNSKSLMSYVQGKTEENIFFEPTEYNHVRQRFQVPSGGGGANLTSRVGQTASYAAESPTGPKLQLMGFVNMTNRTATVLQSKLVPAEAIECERLTDSSLSVVFKGLEVVLEEVFVPFTFFFHTSPTPSIQQLPVAFSLFKTVLTVPSRATGVELHWQGQVAWSMDFSRNAPSVAFIAPTPGASLAANTTYNVRWAGTDPNGDELTYDLYYSSDNGVTYQPLTAMVVSNTFLWTIDLAPASQNQGYLRVEASDGYNTASAVTGPFSVEPKPPIPAIISPKPGERIPDSAAIQLKGQAYAIGDGVLTNDSAYAWSSSMDGFLGIGSQLKVENLTLGTNEITLEASHEGLNASASVAIVIVADTDGDGLADEIENRHPTLNPNDPEDAYLDQDGDGLVHAAEILQFGTNPLDADSDDDGVPDGQEVSQGWGPGNRDIDQDGVPDGEDNCPLIPNPGQEDVDEDGVGDVCDLPPWDNLIITSIQRPSDEEVRVWFRPFPGTLAYRYVLESAPTVDGPWEMRLDLPVRRAEPPDSFMFIIPSSPTEPDQFFRIRYVE